MPIEIEVSSPTEHDQQEHIHFFAYCYSCWSVSEENGDYGPPPLELSWINSDATLDQVIAECKSHEQTDGKEHSMKIVGVIHSPHNNKRLE